MGGSVLEEIKMKVVPIHQRYYDPASNFGIYICDNSQLNKDFKLNKKGEFTIKGNVPTLLLDVEYTATIKEQHDSRFGTGYQILSLYQEVNDKSSQRKYLESILTPTQAKEIFKAYPDEDIIQLIKEDKFDTDKVKGVGKRNFVGIKDKILDHLEMQEALAHLSQYQISNKIIMRLVKHFKSAKLLIEKLEENPYNLLAVRGIGFLKADAIALNMGYDKEGEHRIVSAIQFMVEEEQRNGHTYITKSNLLESVYQLLYIDKLLIEEYVKDTDKVLIVGEKVTTNKVYQSEKYVSERLKDILDNSSELNFDVDKFIREQEKKHDMTLTDQQKSFFYNIQKYNVNFLIGFAGTGKTMMQKLLIELLEELKLRYLLLSPTAKAAKVLQKYTNREAITIHRAIGLGEDNEEETIGIEEEFVVVDESSMSDVQLTSTLLHRLEHENVRVLFIGDPFQIPSVNCGNFLHDSIESGVLPVTKLDIVFRQKDGGILDLVTRIRKGERFINNSDTGIYEFGNNAIIASVPQVKMEGGYKYYYNELLKDYRQEDIMMLSPTKKGNLGTVIINQEIQSIVNPAEDSKRQVKYGKEIVYKPNDLILNTKNTYKIKNMNEVEVGIVNGDTGKIVDINTEDKEMIVDFEFDVIPISFTKLDQILHSWCMTAHKSQGSSSPVVVAILDKAHKFQINANLLYTMCTRAEDKLIILCQADVINFAMKKVANLSRNTFLKTMLLKSKLNEEELHEVNA
jgi:exodeoxyribonuclease V alpha subunit